jgi:UDP-arabinose 4-epimerase
MSQESASKQVLVTGGAGYIGSHTCKALAAAGYTPVAFDNLGSGHRGAVRWGPFEEADLSDRIHIENILRTYKIDAVIHFAAYAYVGESMGAPGKYFRNNVVNTLNLLEAMETVGVKRLVFSSTCATYGVPTAEKIAEDHPQRPVNPYGESKLFIEKALHWYGVAHRFQWMALRYFNAAGADPEGEIGEHHDPETHLIPNAIFTALGRRPTLQIMGTDYPTHDGTAIRDYIHVTDLADAHVRALRYLEAGGAPTALNLGTGTGYTVWEVVDMVQRISGAKINVTREARREGDPPMLLAAPGRARQLLGWNPQWSKLETIVQTALNWHKAVGANASRCD